MMVGGLHYFVSPIKIEKLPKVYYEKCRSFHKQVYKSMMFHKLFPSSVMDEMNPLEVPHEMISVAQIKIHPSLNCKNILTSMSWEVEKLTKV